MTRCFPFGPDVPKAPVGSVPLVLGAGKHWQCRGPTENLQLCGHPVSSPHCHTRHLTLHSTVLGHPVLLCAAKFRALPSSNLCFSLSLPLSSALLFK